MSLRDIQTVTIGGIRTACTTRAELAAQMLADVERARRGALAKPQVLIASNGSVIAQYHRDPSFRALIEQADLVDPDGMPLVLATRMLLRRPSFERVATTDFIADAAAAAAANGVRFYFLGAKPGIAERARARLIAQFPDLQVVGARHGYFDAREVDGICEDIRASNADVLWLGLGSPLQERFAIHNREKLRGLAWIRTCGGMFDHLGADVPRAPMWMQRIGFEWLHRATLEPRRLGLRYLSTNPSAVYHLLSKTRP